MAKSNQCISITQLNNEPNFCFELDIFAQLGNHQTGFTYLKGNH